MLGHDVRHVNDGEAADQGGARAEFRDEQRAGQGLEVPDDAASAATERGRSVVDHVPVGHQA